MVDWGHEGFASWQDRTRMAEKLSLQTDPALENLLSIALQSFRERIEVIGRVKYRKDGMPVSIQASKIINFPKKSEIPSLSEMRNMLNGIAA